jgi:hypothetical protein
MFSMSGSHLDSDLLEMWFKLVREKGIDALRRGKR